MPKDAKDQEPFVETALNRGGFDGARAKFVLDVIRNNADIVRELLRIPPEADTAKKPEGQ